MKSPINTTSPSIAKSVGIPPFALEHSPFSRSITTASSPLTAATTTTSTTPQSTFILPAAYYYYNGKGLGHLQRVNDIREFVEYDLNLKRLNDIHKHIWLAGLPMCARPLHHQLSIGRNIVLTERADQHLTWLDDRIFIKPLPRYLMDHSAWQACIQDSVTEENARGFLLSYMWLICSPSDLSIAQASLLLPNDISWEGWTRFSKAVLTNIDPQHPTKINPRFLYGELRIGRLNLIYRFCSKTASWKTFIRGYNYGYHQYSTFVERNFAWVLTIVVYVTLVLTAMQVAFLTNELGPDAVDKRNNVILSRASYGFSVFAMVAPLGVGACIAVVVAVLVVFNGWYALKKRAKARKKHRDLLESCAVSDVIHAKKFDEKGASA